MQNFITDLCSKYFSIFLDANVYMSDDKSIDTNSIVSIPKWTILSILLILEKRIKWTQSQTEIVDNQKYHHQFTTLISKMPNNWIIADSNISNSTNCRYDTNRIWIFFFSFSYAFLNFYIFSQFLQNLLETSLPFFQSSPKICEIIPKFFLKCRNVSLKLEQCFS